MGKVAIMTDTISYIPQELADEYQIKIVPMHVIFDGKDHAENEVDLNYYYANFPRWRKEDKLPTTSGVAIGSFLEAYRDLSKNSEGIIYIGHSHRLGMTVQLGEKVKQQIKSELPDLSIEVIDSLTACGSQSLIVLEAARAARKGMGFKEVVDVAHKMAGRVNHIGLYDDLYYLLRGGRIHKARPWAESKISNTAIIELDKNTEGEIRPVSRYKTKGQALEALFDIVSKRSGGKKLHVIINHSDVQAEAEELREKVTSGFSCSEVYITKIGPVVSLQAGMGIRLYQWWSED